MIDKTVCELFAGVGGFRLGLERSSKEWNTVWANQWEPKRKAQHAYDCYCHHFGNSDNHVNKDIACINKSDIPNHNLLVGGFPCQDYSVARTGARGLKGVKGVLWWEIRDVLKEKNPPFVLLENVDRLLKSPAKQRGRDFGIMLACFSQLNYSVEWRVINAADYGFPQRRRRVFIFAYKNNTSYAENIRKNKALSIISNAGFFAKTFDIESIDNFFETSFKSNDLIEISDNFKYEFFNSGFMSNNKIYTAKVTPVYKRTTSINEIIDNNVSEKYVLDENLNKWIYLKGAKKEHRTSKTGHEYYYSEGAIEFPDSINKPARTMLTSEGSLNRSTHVIEDPFTKELRLLTPLEAERIQGFDDNWTDTGMPERFRFFCMGNALVVGLVESMGYTLNDIFLKETYYVGNCKNIGKVI